MTTFVKPMYFDTSIKAQRQLPTLAADDLGLDVYALQGQDVSVTDGTTQQIHLQGSDGSVLAQTATLGHDGTSGSVAVNNGEGNAIGATETRMLNAGFSAGVYVDKDGSPSYFTKSSYHLGGIALKDDNALVQFEVNGSNGSILAQTATLGHDGWDGSLAISNGANSTKVVFNISDTNGGYGSFKNAANDEQIMLDGATGAVTAQSATLGHDSVDGGLSIANAANVTTISLAGTNGIVTLSDPTSGTATVTADPRYGGTVSAKTLLAMDSDGNPKVTAQNQTLGDGSNIGYLQVNNKWNDDSIVLGFDPTGLNTLVKLGRFRQSELQMFNGSNVVIDLKSSDGSIAATSETLGRTGAVGSLSIKDASNVDQVTISGSDGSVLAQTATLGHDGTAGGLLLKNSANTTVVELGLDDGYGAIRLYDTSGSPQVVLDAMGGSVDATHATFTNGASAIQVNPLSNVGEIIGLSLPTISSSAANKEYVDSVAQGLSVKQACGVASQDNLDLSATVSAIDDVLLTDGMRVLVKAQSDAVQNGIYVWSADSQLLSRAADMAAGSSAAGAFTFVEMGTDADSGFVCTTNPPNDIVGTDALAWSQFSGAGQITAGNGLVKNANTISVLPDNDPDLGYGSALSATSNGLRVVYDGNRGIRCDADGLYLVTDPSRGIALLDDVGLQVKADNRTITFDTDGNILSGVKFTAAAGLVENKVVAFSAGNTVDVTSPSDSGNVLGVSVNVVGDEVRVVQAGLVQGALSGAAPGTAYFLGANGALTTDLPASGRVIQVGIAANATDLYVQIRDLGTLVAA